LAKLAKAAGVALVAIPKTCHKWLTSAGCSSTICRFQHPPAQKGRTDLLPLCPEAVGSSCPRLAAGQGCMYRHDGIALMGVPVLPTVTQGTVTGGSTMEIALMAMMQQQMDFFVQTQAATQAQAAATLAGSSS